MTNWKVGEKVLVTVGDLRGLIGTVTGVYPSDDEVEVTVQLATGKLLMRRMRPSRIERA